MVDLQKVGISAVGGALYAAGAVVGAGACAILYFTGSKINAFIDSYMPSIKGTLNASLMTGTSCLVALPLAKVIGRKTESPFAAAAAGALTVFLTTTLATPTVSKMLSTYPVSYIESSLYGLAGVGTFVFMSPAGHDYDEY